MDKERLTKQPIVKLVQRNARSLIMLGGLTLAIGGIACNTENAQPTAGLPTPTPSEASLEPSPTPTPKPTDQPIATATPRPTEIIPTPTLVPTRVPEPTPTLVPTATPRPPEPTPTPTLVPTRVPKPSPTPAPTATPRPPEIKTEIPIGVRSVDSSGRYPKRTCDIVDRRTGTIVTGLQAPAWMDRKETGEGEKNDKYLTVILEPNQFVLTEGTLVERRLTDKFVFGPIAYIVDEAGSQRKEVTYYVSWGAMTVYATEKDAQIGLCMAVKEAIKDSRIPFSIVFPERWNVK